MHKTQGATIDRVHYLGSDHSYREAALVAGSRHRYDYRLYVVDPDLPTPTTPAGDKQDARWRQDLVQQIGTSRAKQLALDVQAASRELRTRPTEALRAEADELEKQIARYPTQARRARHARERAEQYAAEGRDRAATSRDQRDRRVADRLTRLAHARDVEAADLQALDDVWTQDHSAAMRDRVARIAELERREVSPGAERAIDTRHNPALRRSLEARPGPELDSPRAHDLPPAGPDIEIG